MRSKRLFELAGLAALLVLSAVPARAQFARGWFFECIDPENTTPYSDDYGTVRPIGNDFINIVMGVSGTVTYGGDGGPCYDPARSLPAPGRFAIYNGPVGSRQSGFDDNLYLTVGAPVDAAGDYCYARIIRYADPTAADDTKSALFTASGSAFTGLSNRYFIGSQREGDVETTLEARVIGDAVRMRWRLRNLGTAPLRTGLRFGAYVGMRTGTNSTTGQLNADVGGATQANSLLSTISGIPKVFGPGPGIYVGFNTTPQTKPLRDEMAWLSSQGDFPAFTDFMFGQTNAYGLRIDNQPYENVTEDATRVDHFIVGNHYGTGGAGLIGDPGVAMLMRTRVITDPGQGDPVLSVNPDPLLNRADIGLDEVAFVQTFRVEVLAPGQTRDIVHYLRSPWANANYDLPYAALVDAPRIVEAPIDGSPTSFQIFSYVDNQFATIDQEVPLSNVRMSISFPENSGLRLAAGQEATQLISRIEPNTIGSVGWTVETDGTQLGALPYTVTIQPIPSQRKVLPGTVLVSASARIRLAEGANFVTMPWSFADSSLDAILGLASGRDYLAYRWDPDLGEYVPAISAERGQGVWIVPLSDQGYTVLQGAQVPTDTTSGGLATTLRPGWNMIGNPYNYPVPFGQLVGVAEDDPRNSLTWQQLIDNQLISPSLAYWLRNPEDPNSGTYQYTESGAELMSPNRGYWVFVTSFQPIRLIWPAVFVPGLPGSSRTATAPAWRQSEKQWRLQLSARLNDGMDANNYVGVAGTTKDVIRLTTPEPPRSPKGKIELAVDGELMGKPSRLSSAFETNAKRHEWTVKVNAQEAGEVTLTWPNIGSVPRNARLQLTDPATKTVRDLRFSSNYTFRMDEPGTREFVVKLEPGTAGRAVIGNVLVTRPGRDPRAPFTIAYSLSAQATTTIRVLSGTGREVYTVSRGRADNAGENTAIWTMRDNANRSVAPGAYRVEILAETDSGERVRKIVPVNVVR